MGADRMGTLDLVHIDHVDAVQNGEMDRLLGMIGQTLHGRTGDLDQVHAANDMAAQFPDPRGELIGAVLWQLTHVALKLQRDEEPVHIALGKGQLSCKIGDATRGFAQRKRFEQSQPFCKCLIHA